MKKIVILIVVCFVFFSCISVIQALENDEGTVIENSLNNPDLENDDTGVNEDNTEDVNEDTFEIEENYNDKVNDDSNTHVTQQNSIDFFLE